VSQTQLLELDVTADPGVLLRIVSLCHKRGIAIVSLRYDSAAAGGHVVLGLRGDAAAAGRAALWLDAIVPVLAVRPGNSAPGRLTRVIVPDTPARQSPPPLGTLAP
jgi:hypothetical protein